MLGSASKVRSPQAFAVPAQAQIEYDRFAPELCRGELLSVKHPWAVATPDSTCAFLHVMLCLLRCGQACRWQADMSARPRRRSGLVGVCLVTCSALVWPYLQHPAAAAAALVLLYVSV